MERVRRFLRSWGMWIGVGLAALAAWIGLRTPAGPLRSWADLEPYLGNGRPLLIEVYSNG